MKFDHVNNPYLKKTPEDYNEKGTFRVHMRCELFPLEKSVYRNDL